MLKLFKKSIWIPYEDSTVYPTVAKAQQAIIKYCEDNGFLYEFTADDEVVIDGIKHEIFPLVCYLSFTLAVFNRFLCFSPIAPTFLSN